MKLWSDGKTFEEIENWLDSSEAIYNLHEDCLVLKEKNQELIANLDFIKEAILAMEISYESFN